MEKAVVNSNFVSDDIHHAPRLSISRSRFGSRLFSYQIDENAVGDRDHWGKGVEFVLSCIAMSVGLGNVWRFPFIALQNGGGAFVIPYIIILLLVGKPSYFLEMIMGQFSSRGSVKVFDCVPALRGVGFGQLFACICISTYYSSIMAITLRYFVYSFNSELPWGVCDPKWTEPCYPAKHGSHFDHEWENGTKSSTELYFFKEVLHTHDSLSDGIGLPNWNLVGFLIAVWAIIFLVLFKGIRITGKFSYLTGIVPFIFLFVFLIRAVTLPGALDGIRYFFQPKWDDIAKPSVWYAACTQLFFSLNVFLTSVIMYSSYNKFDHKINRDSNIVTTLDTLTSLLAGCITFGIVGHLAHELKVDDIQKVFRGGPGLVFITYAETISKFNFLPQFFSILFFLMLFILALGSVVAMTSSVITVFRDEFKSVKTWHVALGYSIFGVLTGSIYTTPGGQSILNLVDHYGVTFVVFILAVFEMIAFCYIYGVNRICKDVEFMLGYFPGFLWRWCWWVTPLIMISIVIYTFVFYEHPKDSAGEFPTIAHVIGWCITAMGLIWLPMMMIMKIFKEQKEKKTLWNKIKDAFRPTFHWGPKNEILFIRYREYMREQ